MEASVTNTGKRAGKEVVQLYYGAPQGKLGKPAKELGAYRKTRLLQPGETQRVVLSFTVEDMASFDDLGKVAKSAYVLEAGSYVFYVGNNVRDAKKLDFTYDLAEAKVTAQYISWKNVSLRMEPTKRFRPITALSRKKDWSVRIS